MGLFRRAARTYTSIADQERELAVLRARRDVLTARLPEAEAAVERALADQRARLLESDLVHRFHETHHMGRIHIFRCGF